MVRLLSILLFLSSQNHPVSNCVFCRFMIKQVEKLCDGRGNAKGQRSSWSSVRDQITNTFVLRLVSCIQLASKLSLHYSVSQLSLPVL